MDFILGIDPGSNGAMALVYANGAECDAWDMPKDIDGFVDLWKEVEDVYGHPVSIYIEHAHSMPNQGVSSTFKYGMWYGAILLWASYFKTQIKTISPRIWKKHFSLGRTKKDSIFLAQELYPDAPVVFMKHHHRAEAILIAEYGRKDHYGITAK